MDSVKVLYVETPGFYAFNFLDLVGSHYRDVRFNGDFVPGYNTEGTLGNPSKESMTLPKTIMKDMMSFLLIW